MRSMERFRLPESHAQSSGCDLQRSAVVRLTMIPGDPDQEIPSRKMKRQVIIKDGGGGADLTLNLQSELLQLIASKLTNICDYIRFRSVCIRWRSVNTGGGGGLLPHRWLPLLILPLTVEGDFLPVFNTADRRFYNLPLPEEVQGPLNTVTGSAYGWLVIVDRHDFTFMKVYLYNPITRSCILLPPIPYVLAFTVLLCCNPTTASPGQLLLSITRGYMMPMLIYRQGDVCWTEIKKPPGFRCSPLVTYLEEEATIYFATPDGMLAVLDLASLTFRILIRTSSPEIKSLMAHMHLVASAGDLFFVASDDPRDPDSIFKLFKLERDTEGCLKWARAATIGDCTLFVTRVDSLTVMCDDQGSFDRQTSQTNIIYQFSNFSNPGRYENGVAGAVKGCIQVWDLIAGVKLCFEIISKRIYYKNLLSHRFTWMVPNMS